MKGTALGIQFLRHVERTRLLVHLVDVSEMSGRDPAHDFDVILKELRSFDENFAEKPMLVAASKIDVCQDTARIEAVRKKAEEHGYDFIEISSVTGTGIDALRFAIAGKLFAEAVPAS